MLAWPHSLLDFMQHRLPKLGSYGIFDDEESNCTSFALILDPLWEQIGIIREEKRLVTKCAIGNCAMTLQYQPIGERWMLCLKIAVLAACIRVSLGSCTVGGTVHKDTFVHKYECTQVVMGLCTKCEEKLNPRFFGMLSGVILGSLVLIFMVTFFCCPTCCPKEREESIDEEVRVSLLTPASAAGYQVGP